jgi:hypothetical protein
VRRSRLVPARVRVRARRVRAREAGVAGEAIVVGWWVGVVLDWIGCVVIGWVWYRARDWLDQLVWTGTK